MEAATKRESCHDSDRQQRRRQKRRETNKTKEPSLTADRASGKIFPSEGHGDVQQHDERVLNQVRDTTAKKESKEKKKRKKGVSGRVTEDDVRKVKCQAVPGSSARRPTEAAIGARSVKH